MKFISRRNFCTWISRLWKSDRIVQITSHKDKYRYDLIRFYLIYCV